MSAACLMTLCLSACVDGRKVEPVVVTISDFCLTKKPWRPADEELAATSPAERRVKLADNEYGQLKCGWTP
jgi:hypothetical protein